MNPIRANLLKTLPRPAISLAPACVLVLCALVPDANAGELSVNGFGTVGVAYVDQPEGWAYARSIGQRVHKQAVRADLDTVFGVQVNYRAGRHLEFVGQATAASLHGDARAEDHLGLAYLAWRPDVYWTVRVGRVNHDAYLISDHRDVGYTHQFIRPPVEYYSRMPTSLDGADVSRTWVRGDVQWQAKFFSGGTSTGVGDGRIHLQPLYGALLAREADGLLTRISAVHARTEKDVKGLAPLREGLRDLQQVAVPQVAAQARHMEGSLLGRGDWTSYLAAAIAYDRNNWLLSAEINRASSDADSVTFTSGYLTFGRRFGALTVFVAESTAIRDHSASIAPDWGTALASVDADLAARGELLAQGAAIAINRASADQSSTAAGLRWDMAPGIALKAQWDHVRTSRNGGGLWLASDSRGARSNVFAVAADFVF